MKIVIDIPEEDYNSIEPFLNGQTVKGGFNLFKVLEMIKNGTPLPEQMTKEKTIKSALKFLVQKQIEQGSWGFSDDDDDAVTWNEVIEWLDQQPYIQKMTPVTPSCEEREKGECPYYAG